MQQENNAATPAADNGSSVMATTDLNDLGILLNNRTYQIYCLRDLR